MLDVVAAIAFAGFVLLALRLLPAGQPEATRRRRVNVFLIYLLAASFTAGLGQRDLWPFSSWPLIAATLGDEVTHLRLVAVDATGDEHDVDYRAWEPLAFDELMAWMDTVFVALEPAVRDDVAETLLGRAEEARRSGRFGTSDRFFGPLAAPYFLLHPAIWQHADDRPERPFVGLRYYRETWSLEARARGAADLRRQLVYESRGLR